MDYVIKKIIHSLYKWTVKGHISWEQASKNRYKEVTGIDEPKSKNKILICEQKIDNESYFIVLTPYVNLDNDEEIEEIIVLVDIIKDKDYLYSIEVSEEDIEGLWFEASFSKVPFGKFLRHLEPLYKVENGLLKDDENQLSKAIESITQSQNVNEVLERHTEQIDFLMHKVSLLEEELFMLKKSRATVR